MHGLIDRFALIVLKRLCGMNGKRYFSSNGEDGASSKYYLKRKIIIALIGLHLTSLRRHVFNQTFADDAHNER